MFKLKKIFCIALCVCLLPTLLLAETAQYTATTTKALKLKKEANANARGIGSIPEGKQLSILEIVGDHFKVDYNGRIGYVSANYFKDFAILEQKTSPIVLLEDEMLETVEPVQAVATNNDFNLDEGFVPRYVAKNTDTAVLYAQPDQNSNYVTTVPKYSFDLELSQICGEWAMAKYMDKVGYIKTEFLVQYDFIDPYAERFPGIVNYKYAAVFAEDTPLIDQKNPKKIHKVIPAGAVIGVEAPDENGLMHVAYMKRRHALVKQSNAIRLVEVKNYDEAQKGDLISVFTTFFPVHNSNADIIGRVYNMYHSTSMLNGKILQPGEQFSMNQEIGPYKKKTGYKKAPIASKTVSVGYGGGTCQVNTTMYNSLLQVPVHVKHRRVHSKSGAVYVPVGFDAAVGSLSSIDMRFENTLPYPIMLQYYVSDNILTSLIYRAE